MILIPKQRYDAVMEKKEEKSENVEILPEEESVTHEIESTNEQRKESVTTEQDDILFN